MANNPFDPPIVQVKKTLDRGGIASANRGFGSIAAPSISSRPAPGPENLSELDDVDGSVLPNDGDSLFFDSESELWTPGEAFRPDLSTPPTYGQTLVWNGTAWVPGSSGGGGGGAVYSPADLPRAGDLYFDPFTSLDPGWAVYNSGAGVSYVPGDFGLVGKINADTTQMRPLLRDCPAGNFRIETAIHELFQTNMMYPGAALLVTNSAATFARSLVVFFNAGSDPSSLQIAGQSYSPLSNRVSNTGLLSGSLSSAPLYLALNVYNDGGWKIDFEWSRTGQFWQRVSSAFSLAVTPGKVGISMYDRNGNGGQALFKWFRVRSL